MRLKNKVAIITGGASGIGEATVFRFLKEGARVVVADYNSETGGKIIDEACDKGFQNSVSFIKVDVAVEDDVAGMLEHAQNSFGTVDIVFNNAGVGGAIGPLTETTVASWDYTMDVVAKGVFLGIKHAARHMIKLGRGGSIINTSSIAALSGDGGPLVYSAAKAAVLSLTKSAAVELARHKIRVNAVCPGCIVTPIVTQGKLEETRAAFSKVQPWPEYGDAEHIAGTALFLASEDSRFITGEHILVDGGLTAVGPEMSIRLPSTSARYSNIAGVTKGSTGEAPEITKLD